MSIKNREFTSHGVKFAIVESNNADWKWQAMRYDENYNAWVRTMYYGNTQAEIKERVKEEATTEEETTTEEEDDGFYYRSLIDNKLMTVGNFFDMCYITFITTYNHDIDILNDYFNGDYDKIEKTTKEEIINIISLYIIKWCIANMRLVEIHTHGGGKCRRRFLECVTKCFREYKRKCKQYFHII